MALGSIPGEFSFVFRFSFRTENGWGGGGDIHCEIFHPPTLTPPGCHSSSSLTVRIVSTTSAQLHSATFREKKTPKRRRGYPSPALPPPTRVKYPPPSSILLLLLLLLLRPHSLSIFGKARSPSFGAGPSAGWVRGSNSLFLSLYDSAFPPPPPLPPHATARKSSSSSVARAPACPKRGAAASSPVPDWADVSLEMERGFMGRPSPRAQGRDGERGERKGHRWNLSLSFSDKKEQTLFNDLRHWQH